MSRGKKKACFRDQDLVKAVTEGLDPRKKKSLSLHLETCSLCRRKFLLLMELDECLKSSFQNKKLSADQVDFLKQQAGLRLAELERKISFRPARRPSARFRWLAGALLGLILVGAALWFFWLRPDQPILRDLISPPFRLITPTGKLASPPAEFRWEKISGAKSYEFILTDEKLTLIHAQRTTVPELLLPEAKKQVIKRGEKYFWVVEALDETEQKIASASSFFFVE